MDGVAVVFNNVVGNKIDYYLSADATYVVTADARTGSATARLDVEMTNAAPTSGEPGYVIGNPIGLPVGTNRTRREQRPRCAEVHSAWYFGVVARRPPSVRTDSTTRGFLDSQ